MRKKIINFKTWDIHASWVSDTFNKLGEAEGRRFEKNLDSYASFLSHRRLLESNLVSGKRVLEVGCGPGVFTEILAKSKPKSLVVCDISSQQICQNKLRARRLKYDKFISEWICADITTQVFNNREKFDLILCYGGLFSYLFDAAEFVLKKLHSRLAPSGVLLGSVMSFCGTLASHHDDLINLPKKKLNLLIKTKAITKSTVGSNGHFCQMFTAESLNSLLTHGSMFKQIELRGSNVILPRNCALNLKNQSHQILTRIHSELTSGPESAHCGDHILFKATKR